MRNEVQYYIYLTKKSVLSNPTVLNVHFWAINNSRSFQIGKHKSWLRIHPPPTPIIQRFWWIHIHILFPYLTPWYLTFNEFIIMSIKDVKITHERITAISYSYQSIKAHKPTLFPVEWNLINRNHQQIFPTNGHRLIWDISN